MQRLKHTRACAPVYAQARSFANAQHAYAYAQMHRRAEARMHRRGRKRRPIHSSRPTSKHTKHEHGQAHTCTDTRQLVHSDMRNANARAHAGAQASSASARTRASSHTQGAGRPGGVCAGTCIRTFMCRRTDTSQRADAQAYIQEHEHVQARAMARMRDTSRI